MIKKILLIVGIFVSVNAVAFDFELKESLYEDSKIKTQLLSSLTVKKLNQVQEMVDQGNIQQALNSLNRTLYQVKSPYEKSVIIQNAAHIILLTDNTESYLQAINLFEAVTKIDAVTDSEQRNVILNIALLYGQLENYKQAVFWFQKWIQEQQYAGKEVSSKKWMQLAQFYQLDEQLKISETYYQKAIKQAIKNKETVNESWYVQWLSVNYSLENFKKSEAILTLLISLSPENLKYYRQLAGIYEWQDQSKDALSVWEMAYKQDLLTDKNDIILLAQLLLRFNYPLKASKVLDQFFKETNEPIFEQDYELLASSFNEAKEYEKAISAYRLAFAQLNNPKYAQIIAQLYLEKQKIDSALNILNEVTRNQTGGYYLLLGYVYVQLNNNKKALASYEKALGFDSSADQAKEWLDYLNIVLANQS